LDLVAPIDLVLNYERPEALGFMPLPHIGLIR